MKKKTMKKKSGRSARKAATKRARRKSSTATTRSHVPTRGLYGWITHTELASSNPTATKAWCAKVLGWTFKPSMPMPGGGEYHLFAYSDQGGGGIRATNPSETPGSTFTVHVADTRASFEKALREGAEAMVPPTPVMPGVTIAVVRAPGGVPVGFSGP
jgi:uncharacterized protein